MGIRQAIAGNNALGYSVAGCLIVGAGIYFYFQEKPARLPDPLTAFYSDDDGKTYFKDSIYKFAPFDHNGKEADLAYVFECDSGKFVGMLGRYTPKMKKQLEDEFAKSEADPAEKPMLSR